MGRWLAVLAALVLAAPAADDWETRWGFDPADPADRNGDPDADGYTNLEEHLNQTRPRSGGCGLGAEIALVLAPLLRLRRTRFDAWPQSMS